MCFLLSPRLQLACCCKPHFPRSHPDPFRAETHNVRADENDNSDEMNVQVEVVIDTKHVYHVDAAVLSVVDLVVPDNGAAVGSDLNSRQGVTIDVIALY